MGVIFNTCFKQEEMNNNLGGKVPVEITVN